MIGRTQNSITPLDEDHLRHLAFSSLLHTSTYNLTQDFLLIKTNLGAKKDC
jgi:hypothetical protein